jgi:hypothetical protein
MRYHRVISGFKAEFMVNLALIFYPTDRATADRLMAQLKRLYFEVVPLVDLHDAAHGIDNAETVIILVSSSLSNALIDYVKAQRKPIVAIGRVPDPRLGSVPIVELDADSALRALLSLVPPPLSRDFRRLDPEVDRRNLLYLRTLVARWSRVNLTHLLDVPPQRPVTLADIYIPLKIDVTLNIRRGSPVDDWWLSATPDPHAKHAGARSIGNFTPRGRLLDLLIEKIKTEADGARLCTEVLDAETAIALSPHLVITGDPGGGKSTVLKHVMLSLAGDMLSENGSLSQLRFWSLPAYTPIYIEMRDLVSTVFPQTTSRITLEGLFEYLSAFDGSQADLPELREEMMAGDVIFLLDGLDEVPQADDPARREQIKTFIRLIRREFLKCRIVVTSRPYAYAGDWTLENFNQIHLASPDPTQLQTLARRLFSAVLPAEAIDSELSAFNAQRDRLPESIQHSPLFFTLIVALWLNNAGQIERLPANRSAMYRECIQILVRRWTRLEPGQSHTLAERVGLQEPDVYNLLKNMAFRVYRDWQHEEDVVFESDQILKAAQSLNLHGIDVPALLEAFRQQGSVIYEVAPDRFQFAHRSLQEYLAAAYLSQHYPDLCAQTIAVASTHWHNVVDLLPDELYRNNQDLSLLIDRLLHVDRLTQDHEDQGWCIYYAWHMLRDRCPDRADLHTRLIPWLVKILEWGVLPVTRRAELGDALAELGDPRPGVGVSGGLPDLEWCPVPAGRFVMGDPGMQHSLDLPAFQITKYPITVAQYQAFVDAADGFQNPHWWESLHSEARQDRSSERGGIADHPAVNVSWYEAMSFCAWLASRLGKTVRLPTEQEWEKAARSIDERTYPWGADYVSGFSNLDERWGSAYSLKRTTTVGLYPQGVSPYGALDMSGNVWEWTLTDYWRSRNDTLKTDAPRTVRGGSWRSYESFATTFFRHTRPADFRAPDLGFRVILPE